mgnify:CR=1 FL=1
MDVEIKSHLSKKDGRIRFIGRVYASEAKGILREHLAEIAELLKREGVEGVTYYEYGKNAFLQFTSAFRDFVLDKLVIKPEFPPGKPPAVDYLGGFRFKVGNREMEFKEGVVSGRYEYYAELKFSTREETKNFAHSLRAIGVDARIVGYAVRLDSDAFFGLLAATDATPPGLTLLYRSDEDDFRVYASMEDKRMRFYFAVKHEGVWRAVEGLYVATKIQLARAEREVLEAIRGAVAKALKKLGGPADVEEPREDRDKKGIVKVYHLHLYTHHLTPFLEHAAERVEAKPAEVRLEGRRVVVKAGNVEAILEFKPLKQGKAEYLTANDVEQTLAL